MKVLLGCDPNSESGHRVATELGLGLGNLDYLTMGVFLPATHRLTEG